MGVRVQKVQKVQKVQRVQRGRLTGLRPEGCGRLSAAGCVRFAQGATAPAALRVVVSPYRAMSIKPALRDWLSVSYVTQYPVPLIFSFPLEGKSREAGKGVRGKAPIGCSITVLTANRILLIGSLRSPPPIRLRWTSPAVRSVNRKEGPFMGRLRAYFARLAHPMQDVHSGQ